MPKPKITTDWFMLNVFVCPNCNGKLLAKPTDGEWNNTFCEDCNFCCRFETAFNSPDGSILILPTKELDRLLSDKTILPPLMIHFKWKEGEVSWGKIIFYPFISYRFLQEEQNHPISLLPNAKDKSVVYSNMFQLPQIVLYEEPSMEELAEMASCWPDVTISKIMRKFKFGYAQSARLKDVVQKIWLKKGIIQEVADDYDFDENE